MTFLLGLPGGRVKEAHHSAGLNGWRTEREKMRASGTGLRLYGIEHANEKNSATDKVLQGETSDGVQSGSDDREDSGG